MTDDPLLVAAFAVVSVLVGGALPARHLRCAIWRSTACRSRRNRMLRYALRDIVRRRLERRRRWWSRSAWRWPCWSSSWCSQVNLRNEYLGASVFDAPTLVASDLFDDEVEALQALKAEGSDITAFTATPMLRGARERHQRQPRRRPAAARPGSLVPARRAKCPLTYRAGPARRLQARRRRMVAGRLRRPAAGLAAPEPALRPRRQPRRRADLHDLRRRRSPPRSPTSATIPGRAASISSRPSRPACSRAIPRPCSAR